MQKHTHTHTRTNTSIQTGPPPPPPTHTRQTSAKQNQLRRRLYFFVDFLPGDKCVLIEDEVPIEPKTPVSGRRRPLSSRIHKINKELLDTDSNYNCNLDNDDEDDNDDDS